MKKNLEILQKIVRFCFFPLSNLFSSQQPHSQGLLPFQNGGQTREKNGKLLNIGKNHSSVQKIVSTVFFFISLVWD